MKIDKLLLGLCITFFLLIPISFAVNVAQETTSVSRIVGNAPEDLINQLDGEELNLNRADYYLQQEGVVNSNTDNVVKSLITESVIDPTWKFDEIATSLFKANELFVLEAKGELDGNELKATAGGALFGTELTPAEAALWKQDFAKTTPVFVFDSDFAGLSIPNKDSFVTPLARYSTIIAPTFVHSREFVKAFLCNLGDSKTLGNSFREARNKYYENVMITDNELPGLTLMSYHLYGNPLITTVSSGYDKTKLEKYCKDYLGEKEPPLGTQDFEAEEANTIQNSITLPLTLQTQDNFDIIEIPDGVQTENNYELVLPYLVYHHELPKNTILTNITYTFSNPETVTLNIPEYQQGLLVNRSCYEETFSETAAFEQTYQKDKQQINVFIQPVEMKSCSDGMFSIYKSVSYTINYLSEHEMYIQKIEYPSTIKPNTQFTITPQFVYTGTEPIIGEIELYQENQLIYQEEISQNIPQTTIPVTSPMDEGITHYILKVIDTNNTTLAESLFEIETRLLDYTVSVPEKITDTATITINVMHYGATELPAKVKGTLMKAGIPEQSSVAEVTLQPGLNQLLFPYTNLKQSDISYNLQFDIGYNNKREVISEILLANHKPVIEEINDITVKVGQSINIAPSVTDGDNDPITLTIADPIGNDGFWQTTANDVGNYSVVITASDGYEQTTMLVKITVLQPNNAPQLEDAENIIVTAGEIIDLIVFATDADNDQLNYSIDSDKFTKIDYNWFSWNTSKDDIGTYAVEYSVTDGLATVVKEVTITINDTPCSTDCDLNLLTTFSNNKPTAQLSVKPGSEQTVYIKLPKNAKVVSAKATATGGGP
ncbi:hypothetical protein HYY69_00190 [Candidatus Woesearchaeota archaeon]|nr:hypothetical protein [Candidatus Woesearchaeota archaeon]